MMRVHINILRKTQGNQFGVVAVEFALVMFIFFVLLFGIFELGRLFYLWNSVQELTRHAAREAVVRCVDQKDAIKTLVLFGGASLPAGAEITNSTISIDYLDKDRNKINSNKLPQCPNNNLADNVDACDITKPNFNCIKYAQVSITGVSYVPMISLFEGVEFGPDIHLPDLRIAVPSSTVVMPAESLGFIPPAP